jgi:hypothetical protein
VAPYVSDSDEAPRADASLLHGAQRASRDDAPVREFPRLREAGCPWPNVINGWSWWNTMPPRDVKLDAFVSALAAAERQARRACRESTLCARTNSVARRDRSLRFASCRVNRCSGQSDNYQAGSRAGEDGDPFALHRRFARRGWRTQPPIPRIDWVIVGGESGPGARPCRPVVDPQRRRAVQGRGCSVLRQAARRESRSIRGRDTGALVNDREPARVRSSATPTAATSPNGPGT